MADAPHRPVRHGLFGITRVKRAPTHAVVRMGPEEPSGINLSAIWSEVKSLYRWGLHPAIGLHIRHKDRVVLDRTIGHVFNHPGEAPGPVATPDTPFGLFSASKIVTATLAMAMVEDGLLRLDKPVADYLPPFGRHGKHTIKIRHLLNHTAGIPDMPPLGDLDTVIGAGQMNLEGIYDLVPKSPPGVRVAYHPLTSWFVLQEILEQISGTDLRTLLARRLMEPLGLPDVSYGIAPERMHEVAQHAVTGPPVPGFASAIFERTIGVDLDTAVRLTNEPAFLSAVLPSANVVATPAQIGLFMQMLVSKGKANGVQVLKPETVRRMTTDVTPAQLDGTFGFPMRYGLGVMMGGNRFSLFGLGTRGAFGHLGLSNVVVYADPRRELTVAFLNTGKPIVAPGMLQWYAVLQHIAARVPRSR